MKCKGLCEFVQAVSAKFTVTTSSAGVSVVAAVACHLGPVVHCLDVWVVKFVKIMKIQVMVPGIFQLRAYVLVLMSTPIFLT